MDVFSYLNFWRPFTHAPAKSRILCEEEHLKTSHVMKYRRKKIKLWSIAYRSNSDREDESSECTVLAKAWKVVNVGFQSYQILKMFWWKISFLCTIFCPETAFVLRSTTNAYC